MFKEKLCCIFHDSFGSHLSGLVQLKRTNDVRLNKC